MTTRVSKNTILTPKQAGTLDGLFYERTMLSADDIAYTQYNKQNNTWEDTSWNEMAILVGQWQKAISQENLEPGDRIAILMKNCKEWVAIDQAALGLGLVVVPLYLEDRPDNITYILEDSAIKLLAVQDISQWGRLREKCIDNKVLQRVILVDVQSEQLEDESERVAIMDDWLPEQGYVLHKRDGDPHELATIVYTSGTTGRPKGVMLSHFNILSIAHPSAEGLKVKSEDLFLSFLPMSHTFERSLGYYLTVMVGCQVAFARSIQLLADDLIIIKPTLLISVPRIYERVYGKIENTLLKGSPIKRTLFKLTVQIGWNRFLYQQKRSSLCLSCLLWPLMKHLVADKVMQKFGGRLRLAATGGAAIPYPVAKTFIGLGLTLIQGYGLTETSPVASFNRLDNNDPRSIGHPINGVDFKIGESDELLIKSPGVMMGYWNNHAATAQAIDSDGWFHSGDQARIDNKTGHVYITGRLKDILIMSNGEKIPPTDIENTIVIDPKFDQALLLGEGQPYLGAVLVLNSEEWVHIAEQNNLDPFDKDNLQNKAVQSQIVRYLRDVLHDFPGYAKIRKVILTLDPWTVDNGILTPTLKVKRPKVLEQFNKEISELYS
ncbi:MAG: AMP-dependent synthetase/ligase [gamma proteobacterium symbiont of Bathyaustriella thionipta]|nr:AMP-dependent synthetase/ligase [gamma proteobacterium symbiont of Bathyaustriella thionipta]MCU7949815.1 AMP-dependent synthetase/ligase [gamma proteobacterium symbiont of Bathyaustriella thionipta]MCU7951881.1 AMP-dependent synthetase/ligase [gamma proteobacterium symbiont of Bathyaustriella thionipta]MCU7956672.1 AMP-dependent synthetase/ligase [gamma proteobacterium symbiont of Bathyaustriella thionipta]MCU7966453.1 AMP-dependent synthetase/ligase [gamma proteobacterium symbiont of Bathy